MQIEPTTDVEYLLDHGTANSYAALDRFGRMIDLQWQQGSTKLVNLKHGYDTAGNRIYREDVVAASNNQDFDEFYSYDEVNRLQTMDRGILTGTPPTGIAGTPDEEQDWSLDPLGNWSNFIEKTSGTTDLDQDRTHNRANEITDIIETIGFSWANPAHDRAGNMRAIPLPAGPDETYDATWDGWNRLVLLEYDTVKVAEYQYDGINRRTLKETYTPSGLLDQTSHFYYSDQWQVLEERVDSSTDADRQFVWGLRYVDDPILRDRDTTDPKNGTFDERLYALQDANWNVVAMTDDERLALARLIRATVERSESPWPLLLKLGFKSEYLEPLADKLPALCRVLFEPFCCEYPYDLSDWRLGQRVSDILGSDRWNFRIAGPAGLVFLLRAFHGLAYYLEGLATPIFWQRAFQPCGEALATQINDLQLPAAALPECDFGSLARYLKVRVRENGRTKVELIQYASRVDHLDDLLDGDVKQRIERQGIDLAQIVSDVRKRGYAPASLFELIEGSKQIEVWLE